MATLFNNHLSTNPVSDSPTVKSQSSTILFGSSDFSTYVEGTEILFILTAEHTNCGEKRKKRQNM